jgi:hypothetical protein
LKSLTFSIVVALALVAPSVCAEPPQGSETSPPVVTESSRPLRPVGWAVAASGVALMATSELMFYFANTQSGSVGQTDSASRDQYDRQRERAVGYHVTGDVLLAVGGLATVTGISLVLFAPRNSQPIARLELGPRQACVAGSF